MVKVKSFQEKVPCLSSYVSTHQEPLQANPPWSGSKQKLSDASTRLNITQLGNPNYEQQGHQTAEVQKLCLLRALNSRESIHPPSPLTYSKWIKLFCSIRETSHQVKGQGHSVSSTVQSVKPWFSMYCSSTSITWQVCNSICSFCLSVIRVILKN